MFFEQKYEKYQSFVSENIQFLKVKFSIYLNRCIFIMHLGIGMHKISMHSVKVICCYLYLRKKKSYPKMHYSIISLVLLKVYYLSNYLLSQFPLFSCFQLLHMDDTNGASIILPLKASITTAADDMLKYFLLFFKK